MDARAIAAKEPIIMHVWQQEKSTRTNICLLSDKIIDVVQVYSTYTQMWAYILFVIYIINHMYINWAILVANKLLLTDSNKRTHEI